ncbi:MAG: N-acetylmuramoyl-L-alanine amidase LytC precursor [Actinobacteria bacterium ADurb.Bin444]|nr:MAG: N-acetylmuramoyl-L-alanine amidase LytC precursor [Actinobacteria bacterium ADurb.Bin444]
MKTRFRYNGGAARTLGGFILAGVAALMLLLALPGFAGAVVFSDVGKSSAEDEAVQYLVAAKVLAGYSDGTFRPGQPVTRGQAAKIVVAQQGVAPASSACRFADVDSTFAAFVEAAATKGWVGGYPDGQFRPYDSLQRQHMAVILVRSMGWEAQAKALSGAQVQAALGRFPDVNGVSGEASKYVALAVTKGLLNGDAAGRLNPASGVTRAQAALMAYRAETSSLVVGQGFRASAAHADKTRVVLDLSTAPSEVMPRLLEDGSLEVTIPWATVPAAGLSVAVNSKEVGSVTATQGSYRPPSVIVRVELRQYSSYQVFILGPDSKNGYGNRVVVDVLREATNPGGVPLVAIDPGHGGWDPGAVNPFTGTQEKTVNLKIGKRLDELLRGVGLQTVMTRTEDVALGPTLSEDLTRRGQIANEAGATILVMIHNNAHDGDSNGTETFYWGTDDKNYSVEGKALAQTIQRHLVAAVGLRDRGAKTWYGKTLRVLDVAQMPGVMVEVAFMDHPTEGLLLEDPAFLERAARGIARGVLAHLGWDVELVPLT